MTATAEDEAPPRWQDDLYELLRANDVTQSSCRDRFRAALT
jgi:hypothetical protein